MSNPFDEIDPPEGASRIDKLLGKVVSLEGSGDTAVSKKLAKGRYQITPDTAEKYGIDYGRLTNPDYAKRSARRILTDLAGKYPDDSDVLVAWNAGPGRVGKPIAKIPGETQDYLAHNASLDGKNPFDVLDPPKAGVRTPARTGYDPAKFAPRPGAPPRPRAGPLKTSLTGDVIGETGQVASEGFKKIGQGDYDPKRSIGDNALKALDALGGAFDVITSPVQGVARTLQLNADRAASGSKLAFSDEDKRKEFAGEAASSLIPVGGEEAALTKSALKVAEKAKPLSEGAIRQAQRAMEKARMAAPAAKHADKVARLQADGVKLTPGMIKGGEARTAEEARKSSPYVGNAIEQGERQAVESVNRAAYNRVLKPLGETYNGPVGREGIGQIQDRLGKAYDQVLPQATARADQSFHEAVNSAMEETETLPKDKQEQIRAILNRDVMRHFGAGDMDGQTFKTVESQLGRRAVGFKSSADPDQRAMGHILDDINGALRDSVERNSPPGVRQRIKDVNTAYAMFTRVQDAAARRVNAEDGIFNTGDLLASVKKGDRSIRKGSFARRDALLQDFAEDAHSVVRAKLPDSGTARRGKEGGFGRLTGEMLGAGAGAPAGPLGAAGGAVAGRAMGNVLDRPIAAATNALARHNMEKAVRRASQAAGRGGSTTGAPRNYLKAIDSRVSPLVQHRPGVAAGGVNMLRSITDAQQPSGQ